jgi:hypothetical protein
MAPLFDKHDTPRWERPLEIEASEYADDYEVLDSPYWPPPPPPELSPEERERLMGEPPVAALIVLPCWIFHKNDADPWPSRLHGHHNQRPLKLDAITGYIYSIRTREHVQTLRRKSLIPIQTTLLASKDFGARARSLIGNI